MSIFRYQFEVADSTVTGFSSVGAWVDTGASYTLLPSHILESLGHLPQYFLPFSLADGSIIEFGVAQLTLRINGSIRIVSCVFGAEEAEPLLGATALEEFALAADPVNHELVPVVSKLLSFNPLPLPGEL